MTSLLRRKRTATDHVGAVTVLIALWFSMFCTHCMAAAGELPEPGNIPGDRCPHENSTPVSEPPVDGHKTVSCEGVCDASHFTVTMLPKLIDGAFVLSLSADDSTSVGPISQYGAVGAWNRYSIPTYDTPERSYFPPFQRYTVLLN